MTLHAIMTELTAAANARDPSNAPAPSKATAYAANESTDISSASTDPLTYLSSYLQDEESE
jgi:hypothetical protein